MAKLTASKRNKLPAKDFAVKGRRYPVHDRAHARNALARVSQHGTAQEKAAVRRKVHAKFPNIGVGGLKKSARRKGSARKRASGKS